jgi:ABC-type sugar transport system ATPase subunit
MNDAAASPALEMRDISKRFGDIWVLQDINFILPPGAIHGIVGHNGAGKSTLMKIALGAHEPTRGEVFICDQKLSFSKPAAGRELGLGMVLQERSLIRTLPGLDNLFLNAEHKNRARMVRRGKEMAEARTLLDQLGISRRLLELKVEEMSTIDQELLEIAKALRLGDKVLILDEPTAPLGRAEIARLFDVMRSVSARGTGIILITHHLAEVFAITDHVTCLREGSIVFSSRTSETNMSELIRAMLGRTSEVLDARRRSSRANGAEGGVQPSLEVKNLRVGEKLLDVSFEIYPGEILGVAGLAGSGRSTLLRTLFGDIRATHGEVTLNGRKLDARTPRVAIGQGVFLIPEDRGVHGLMLTKPISENVVLAVLQRFVNRIRLLRISQGRALTQSMMTRLDIRARGMEQTVGELSGGNQQKVVLAKALATGADLLLLDEPTFGVDIGAMREIINVVRELAERGTAVLWVTSDLRELLEVSDRILILRDGETPEWIGRDAEDFDEDILIARIQRQQYLDLATPEAGHGVD